MKRIWILLLLFLCAVSIRAQNYTAVTAAVVDPNLNKYAYGSYNISLVNNTGQQPQFGGNPNFQQTYSGALDVNGNLSISLPSVTVMTPSGMQWNFFICANPKQYAYVFPQPSNPVCFTYTSTGTQISGSSVVLTSSFTVAIIPIPVITGTAGTGGAPANVFYLSPNCSTANTANCFFTNWDTIQRADCTLATSTTVTCTASNFTQADVGKRFVDFITCQTDNFTSGQSPNRTQTTITAVNSATNITVGTSGIGSVSGTGCIYYGHSDETGLTAVETALASSTTCPVLVLPSGIGWQEAAHFIQSITSCNNDNGVKGGSLLGMGQLVVGQGKAVTKMFWAPNFSQTTCTGGNSGLACMGGQPSQTFKGFRITGGGNTAATGFNAQHNLFETFQYGRIEDMAFENFGAANASCRVFLSAAGSFNMLNSVIGGFSAQVTTNGTGQFWLSNSSIQDLDGVAVNNGNFRVNTGTTVFSNQASYANGALTPTNGAAVDVFGIFISNEDLVFADGAPNRPLGFTVENGGIMYVQNGVAAVTSGTQGVPLVNNGTGLMVVSNERVFGGSADSAISGAWVDMGGNTITQGTISARFNDDTLTAAAPTISSGFGTSPSVTANAGTIAFSINVGTGGTASSGVIGLPTTATGWVCTAFDITNPTTGGGFYVKQTAGTTTTATLTGYNTSGTATAWTASDILRVTCRAF